MRFTWTTIILFAMWCILSGKFDGLHLGLGGVSALLIALSIYRRRPRPLPVLRLIAYIPWLLWEVLKSNLRVARLVLWRFDEVTPRFVRTQPCVRDERALATLGCSITLTPGTVMVDRDSRGMLVHALDEKSAADVVAGGMSRRIRTVFDGCSEEVE